MPGLTVMMPGSARAGHSESSPGPAWLPARPQAEPASEWLGGLTVRHWQRPLTVTRRRRTRMT